MRIEKLGPACSYLTGGQLNCKNILKFKIYQHLFAIKLGLNMKNDIEKIKKCIESWPAYKKPLTPMEKVVLFEPFVNEWPKSRNYIVSDWEDFLTGFKNSYKNSLDEIRKNVPNANIMKVLNFSYDELRHSRMLAWLLDKNASHMQGAIFFECFLEALNIDISDEYKNEYIVERERPDRIDISIYSKNNFAIFIENKVRHYERERQLDDEYESLNKWSERWNVKKSNRHLVFLTIEGKQPETLSEDRKSLNISYETLSMAISNAVSGEGCKSPYIRRLVNDYIRQISAVTRKLIGKNRIKFKGLNYV